MCASSMNTYSVLFYISVYTPGACLKHGLYMLGDLKWLVSWVGNDIHVQYIQFIHFWVHLNVLSLQFASCARSQIGRLMQQKLSNSLKGCWWNMGFQTSWNMDSSSQYTNQMGEQLLHHKTLTGCMVQGNTFTHWWATCGTTYIYINQ